MSSAKQDRVAAARTQGGDWKVSVSVLDVTPEVVVEPELPCRSFDPELFFAESPADVEFAKSICQDCPIRGACLEGALARREPWGVWGGQLFIAGVVVPRKRPRGRPRKNEVAA
jgi:WhiB family transcriptional regulator, redox-sensing transcriptional regulator